MEEDKFQNLPSKRLYDFLNKKIENKEVTLQQIANILDVYKKNPSSYFHALRTGITSVKLDHILKAQQHFGLNPCELFNKNSTASQPNADLKTDARNQERGYFELLKTQVEIIRSQQQTIHQLVSEQESKG